MSNSKRFILIALTLALTASMASASGFRAADIVYLPAVASLTGGGGANYKTDVVISNLSADRVTVSVAYMLTGAVDNTARLNSMVNLPVLLPFERREIIDFPQAALGLSSANGYLIFFACKENGNCTNADTSGDIRLITVQGRIYNSTTAGTFGQLFPGIPWYNYVSIDSADRQLDKVQIVGVRAEGSVGQSGFRTNIGLVNASQFSTTVLRIRMFSPTGTPVGVFDQTLPPLAHIQLQVPVIFPSFSGNGYATVEQATVNPVPGQEALPGFFAYGSVVDNRTGDPTTLEAQYMVEMPFDCIYGSKPERRLVKRP